MKKNKNKILLIDEPFLVMHPELVKKANCRNYNKKDKPVNVWIKEQKKING